MIVQGVDLSTLGSQFENRVQGRVLILDGDGPCYVAASQVKRVDTALRHFKQIVLKEMFMANAEFCHVHLTARDSFKNGRFNVIAEKPYQGNRNGKTKPPLLEPLREAVANNENWLPEYHVRLHRHLEADDGMMQDAYVLGDRGVMRSDDKDLRMTPYPYYCAETGRVMQGTPFGWLTPKVLTSSVKLVGQGPLFFWAQMLMGDTADNIKGVRKLHGKLCGPDAAYKALKDAKDIHEAANIVFDAYRAENQNIIAEGYLLWLLRSHDDHVLKYFNEMQLTEQNRRFLDECTKRDWYRSTSTAAD